MAFIKDKITQSTITHSQLSKHMQSPTNDNEVTLYG